SSFSQKDALALPSPSLRRRRRHCPSQAVVALPAGNRPCDRLCSRGQHLHGHRPFADWPWAGGVYARRRHPCGRRFCPQVSPLRAAAYRPLASIAPCECRRPPLQAGPGCSRLGRG
ncbi:hypothetical protein BHE74_00058668, partial [Ensete ventricosum]